MKIAYLISALIRIWCSNQFGFIHPHWRSCDIHMLLNYYLAGMRKIEPTMWFRGTAISQHFSTLLSYFEHNDRIFPSSSAISQHSSTCQNTRVYNIVDFKNILFQSSTRIHQNPSDPKNSTVESGFKTMQFRCADSLVSCERKADS